MVSEALMNKSEGAAGAGQTEDRRINKLTAQKAPTKTVMWPERRETCRISAEGGYYRREPGVVISN